MSPHANKFCETSISLKFSSCGGLGLLPMHMQKARICMPGRQTLEQDCEAVTVLSSLQVLKDLCAKVNKFVKSYVHV